MVIFDWLVVVKIVSWVMVLIGSFVVRRNFVFFLLEILIICGDVSEYIIVCNILIIWFLD